MNIDIFEDSLFGDNNDDDKDKKEGVVVVTDYDWLLYKDDTRATYLECPGWYSPSSHSIPFA